MSNTAPSSQKAKSTMLWVQLLAGPVLWSIHFLLVYLLIETACHAGWSFQILGMNGLSFLVIALTVIAVIATVLFGIRSYRSWKKFRGEGRLWDQFRESSQWSEQPAEFVYFSGFLLSALFAMTIVLVGLPALFLHPC